MRRAAAELPEVARRLDDAAAEVANPKTIHHHARGERVVRAGDPLGQSHAPAARRPALERIKPYGRRFAVAGEDARKTGLHNRPVVVVLAAQLDGRDRHAWLVRWPKRVAQRHGNRLEPLLVLLHETLAVFQSIKKITLLFGEKIAGVILYVIAQFAIVSRSGIYEGSYNVTRAANLKAVALAGVLGGEDNDDRANLIVEKLDRPIPRDLGLEKTLVEHQRWRLAKPRKPGLTANLSLAKRGLRHLYQPTY